MPIRSDPTARLPGAATFARAAAALVADRSGARSSWVDPYTIAYGDEMYAVLAQERPATTALAEYVRTGVEAAGAALAALEAVGGGAPRRLLDFGCGFGRATRFMNAGAVANVSACDVRRDAVAWTAARAPGPVFSVDAAPARPHGAPFDVVFAASVFSHLPRARFEGWLDALLDALAPDGLLVFSYLDRGAAVADADRGGGPFAFTARSESAVLPAAEYGLTQVDTAWLLDRFASRDVPARVAPSALWAHQHLCAAGPGDVDAVGRIAARCGATGDATFGRDLSERDGAVRLASGWIEWRACGPAPVAVDLASPEHVVEALLGPEQPPSRAGRRRRAWTWRGPVPETVLGRMPIVAFARWADGARRAVAGGAVGE
ncbi:MAG TPA: class I SAM-dependent methyltransferase [Planctomycetota bacterium]|nr:class I SAM-dependent methyltransferase [Planctomycetota bacterium]